MEDKTYVYHSDSTDDGMELECQRCKHLFILLDEEPLTTCPKCDTKLSYAPYVIW